MQDLNSVSLTGRLVANAENKRNVNGRIMATFSLAFTTSAKDQNGQWTDESNFIKCVYWSTETMFAKLVKGVEVSVNGSLKLNKWTDPNGNNRQEISLVVNYLKAHSQGQTQPQNVNNVYQPQQYQQAPQQVQYQQYQPQMQYQQAPRPQQNGGFQGQGFQQNTAQQVTCETFQDSDIPF